MMRRSLTISLALIYAALGFNSTAAAQTASEEDVQYASVILLCEGRYQAKGTPDEQVFWQELRSDLTPNELQRGQAAIGSVAGALSQINDSIVVQRCEDVQSFIENPDDYVDNTSPELKAAQDRVQGLIQVLVLEFVKSGLTSDYISDILEFGAGISNELESDLERSKWIEFHFQKVIFGLRAQSKTLSAARKNESDLSALYQWAASCAASAALDHSDRVLPLIQSGDYQSALNEEVNSVLLDRLTVIAKKVGLEGQDGLSIEDDFRSCDTGNSDVFNRYVAGPALIAGVDAVKAIELSKK